MSQPKFALKTLIISMATAITLQANAQTSVQEVVKTELPRIDVVGTDNNAVAKQPGSVAIVTQEDLEIIQPISIEDALRFVPGIVIKKEEESGIIANIGMRGLSAGDYKTLILEDGVPVAPGLFVGNGRYYTPRIQRMESIEVLKGAASLRYGPSTIGGVINFKTKTPDDGVSVSSRVGSWGYKESTIEAGGSNPSGDAYAGVVYTKADSDGFMDKDFKMNDLMVKGGMSLGNDQWVSAKFTHYDNEANISYRGLFLDAYNAGKTFNPAPDDYFLTERDSFDINHEWDINNNMRLNTLIYWSQTSRDYWRYDLTDAKTIGTGVDRRWDYADTLGGRNRAFERQGVDTRLNITHNAFGIANETELGLRVDYESMNDRRVNATRDNPRSGTLTKEINQSADSMALFAQNRFIIDEKLAITAGLRVENYTQKTVNELDQTKNGETSNTEMMPGVGVTYQVSPTAQFFGGVYKAFAPAQNTDAISKDGIDQELEAERSTNIEIGVRGGNQKLSYEITAFQMDFENQVIPSNSGGFVTANGGETLHQGLEAALGVDMGAGFTLDVNTTYIPTAKFVGDRYQADGVTIDIADGNRVTYSPELVANLKLGYQTGDLKTALIANYIGEQYSDPQNTTDIEENTSGFFTGKVDAYTTFDVTANYAVNKQLNLFGAVKNLT
ncbi:MAG: TonB-dependent receptor family protein, partial [Pseudomonadota bacterium]